MITDAFLAMLASKRSLLAVGWPLALCVLMLACTPAIRFTSIAPRPAEYGGGYVVVGQCRDGGAEGKPMTNGPCYWLCSPEMGGKVACGRIPWIDFSP